MYFGDIGERSRAVIDYFERNGGPDSVKCSIDANPAEWMLSAVKIAPASGSDDDWFQVWRRSKEYQGVQSELGRLGHAQFLELDTDRSEIGQSTQQADEFAASMREQIREVTLRVFAQYWRTPSYIYSKIALCLGSGLFVGLIFLNSPNTQQGLQNQELAMFLCKYCG